MKTMSIKIMTLLKLCLLGVALGSAALPAITYSVTVTSPVSSYTITAATSGMTSKYYGVGLTSGGNTYVGGLTGSCASAAFCYSISASNYDLTISSFSSSIWPSGFTGTIGLRGLYPTLSTGSNDFLPIIDNTAHTLTVCSGCTSSSYVKRNANFHNFVGDSASSVTVTTGFPSCNGTIYAYVAANGRQVFATTASAGTACFSSTTNTDVVALGSSAYPTDALMKEATFNQGILWLTQLTDDRPWAP